MNEKELKLHQAVQEAVKDFEFKVGDEILKSNGLRGYVIMTGKSKNEPENNYLYIHTCKRKILFKDCTKIWNEGELMEMLQKWVKEGEGLGDTRKVKWECSWTVDEESDDGNKLVLGYRSGFYSVEFESKDLLNTLLEAAIYVLTGEEWKEGE